MKAALLAVWAAATLAAAKPHGNSHRHLHDKKAMHAHGPELVKRNPQSGYGDDPLEGPATWVCNLGGRILSEDECREGMRNGTLRSDEGEIPTWSPPPQTTSSSISSTWISTSYSTPSSSSTPSPSSYASSSSSSSSNSDENVAIAAASASSSGDSSSSSASSYSGAGGNGVDSDFPDGQLDCSDFPDEYGAMAVNYLGLGGWTGVQCPGDSSGGGFNNIETVTSGGCREGCFCSYACPAGYQKMQWPSMQGLTGQSVGGIQCKNGKLHLTNDDTKNLCGSGVSGVTVQIQNKLPKNCAVCRTDYPGKFLPKIPSFSMRE